MQGHGHEACPKRLATEQLLLPRDPHYGFGGFCIIGYGLLHQNGLACFQSTDRKICMGGVECGDIDQFDLGVCQQFIVVAIGLLDLILCRKVFGALFVSGGDGGDLKAVQFCNGFGNLSGDMPGTEDSYLKIDHNGISFYFDHSLNYTKGSAFCKQNFTCKRCRKRVA